jgi:hypothetical protein
MADEHTIELSTDETPNVAFSGDQFERLIEAIRGNRTDQVEAEAEIHALAMKKQLSPSNDTCPEVSVYNPRGERDHPRPLLQCDFFLGSYPLDRDTLTLKEIDLMNQLEPGSFEVTKGDGQVVVFHVIPRFKMDGKTLDRLTIAFPCGDNEQKQNFPPFSVMLREVVDQIEVKKLTTR